MSTAACYVNNLSWQLLKLRSVQSHNLPTGDSTGTKLTIVLWSDNESCWIESHDRFCGIMATWKQAVSLSVLTIGYRFMHRSRFHPPATISYRYSCKSAWSQVFVTCSQPAIPTKEGESLQGIQTLKRLRWTTKSFWQPYCSGVLRLACRRLSL